MLIPSHVSFCGRDVPCHASGPTVKSLVILLHGYGADGRNLLSLAHAWDKQLPDTLFLAPHAVEKHPIGGGYQWFDLPPGGPSLWLEGLQRAADHLVPFIWDTMNHYGLNPNQVALAGFSQGAMLALHIGLYQLLLGAVVSYSGLLVPSEQAPKFFPPILLAHGDQDNVLPIDTFWQTRKALDRAFVRYTPLVLENVPHSISTEASVKGCDFLAQNLKF